MLQAYSINATVTAGGAVPFNSVALEKGCTAKLTSPSTIELNKCGVYMVSVDATAAASTTLQLTKDGTALPQAQSTGTTPSFMTLVQVATNNSCCACSSPVVLRLLNTVATTLTDCNIVVTKVV